MSTQEKTMLTKASGYNVNRILFSKPIIGNVPNSTFTFKRINISTKNSDGSVGELIIPTERCFSFGVQENLGLDKKTVNGYVLPICLFTKDAPTKAEREWVDTFEAIVKRCSDYLIDHKDDLEEYELEEAHLKKLNPLYYKKEKGKRVEGAGPTLYPKLIQSKKLDKIQTKIVDKRGNELDPLSIQKKYCYVKAAIKIEGIYIGGGKYTLQVKLYNAQVELLDSGIKMLLAPEADDDVFEETSVNPMMSSSSSKPVAKTSHQSDHGDDDEEEGSIKGSDDEAEVEVEEEEEKPKTKVVKKVTKVVKKPKV